MQNKKAKKQKKYWRVAVNEKPNETADLDQRGEEVCTTSNTPSIDVFIIKPAQRSW